MCLHCKVIVSTSTVACARIKGWEHFQYTELGFCAWVTLWASEFGQPVCFLVYGLL